MMYAVRKQARWEGEVGFIFHFPFVISHFAIYEVRSYHWLDAIAVTNSR